MLWLTVSACLAAVGMGKIYFSDDFATDPFAENRWVISDAKKASGEQGAIEWSGGLWPASEGRKGMRTTEDAKFYMLSTTFEEFDNEGKTLAVGFTVKHEQKMDCGGGYLKLLAPGTDQSTFNGESPYSIMFGPDICGYSTKRVHAILNHDDKNVEKKDEVKCSDDKYTHSYLLVLNADDTYSIEVDGEEKASGTIQEGWEVEKPKEIKDPEASKPEDWVDNEMMDDPDDTKPDDWDDEPEKIADPEASEPEDWDAEEDGEWEAPMIPNPEYKGVWRAKRIKNPDYKGKWEHPMIPNPDYVAVKDVYKRGPLGVLGIEVWQVKSGTVFADFVVADDAAEAKAFLEKNKVDTDAEKEAETAYKDAEKAKEEAEAADEEDDLDEEPKVEL